MSAPQNTIPRKGVSEPSYQVHRPSEAAPSSPNQVSPVNYQDVEDGRPNTPPPYSGPTTPAMTPVPPQQQSQIHYPGLPRLEYKHYSPPTFTLSEDYTTITSYNKSLNTYPSSLVNVIQNLATVPPKPIIRILGKNSSGGTDFDVKINLMNLIVPDNDKRRMNYVKLAGTGEMEFRGETKPATAPNLPDLEAWVKRYCEDPNAIKHFVLERTITNWDTNYLEGRLLSLVASTSYTGHTTITFFTTHNKVVIHSPDRVNRFFSNVTKVFTGTKKYEVVKSIWPYADVPRGEVGRRCAVQEEEVWLSDWRDAIRQAVMGKRKGWCTGEDRLEFLMEPKIADSENPAPWGG